MPIENALWKVGNKPAKLRKAILSDEKLLEKMILAEPTILSDNWMLIGNQVKTNHGGFIDLLAVDENQSLIVIELKKQRTPRDVVAQALDYASWVRNLETHDLSRIYQKFTGNNGSSFQKAYMSIFGNSLDEEELNQNHQIVVVAAELDPSTERIVNYLNGLDVPINVLFFQVFEDSGQQYLSRTWLLDPIETESKATATGRSLKTPWNEEFYVSFGTDTGNDGRNWEDARKYGFICAGGGRWYSQTLNQLNEGSRVWVNIPHQGYVGVGKVVGPVTRADEFKVNHEGNQTHLMNLPIANRYGPERASDEDKAEYFVPIEWIATKPADEAVSQVGFFGNQNSVCKPRTAKWPFTVETLSRAFNINLG